MGPIANMQLFGMKVFGRNRVAPAKSVVVEIEGGVPVQEEPPAQSETVNDVKKVNNRFKFWSKLRNKDSGDSETDASASSSSTGVGAISPTFEQTYCIPGCAYAVPTFDCPSN